MKKGETKKESKPIISKKILIPLIIIALAVSIYFTFFFVGSCNNSTCFDKALAKCKKIKFTNMKEEVTWFYRILGVKDKKCLVEVKSVKINLPEAKSIENKEMICYLSRGLVIPPESDIANCHGLLKEGLQDIIIDKLHLYIAENIGQISAEATKPI
jgi:hypothetical protein